MYLYEKEKDKVSVYELKEIKDMLFNFRKKEMEKINKDRILFNVLSNNEKDIHDFKKFSLPYDKNKFINKNNNFFKHKNGLKLNNVYSVFENGIIIDGLLYRLYRGEYDYYVYDIREIYDKDPTNITSYLLLTTSTIEKNNKKSF